MRAESYHRIKYLKKECMNTKYIALSIVCLIFLTMCAGAGYSVRIKKSMTPGEIATLAKDLATDSSLSYDQKNRYYKELSVHTIEIIKGNMSKVAQSSPKEVKRLLGEVYDILATNKDMLIKYAKDEYQQISREYRDVIANKVKEII